MNNDKEESLNLRFRKWIKRLKEDFNALRVALEEDLVPWYVKILIILIVAYALSPIDLIPDFIPVLGLLDDLVISPVLIYISIKMIPEGTMKVCREMAKTREFGRKKNWVAGAFVIFVWLIIIGWAAWLVWDKLK